MTSANSVVRHDQQPRPRGSARALVAVRRAAGLLTGGQRDELPETFWYSVKRRLLGPPMVNEQLRRAAAVQAARAGRAVPRRHLLLGLRHRGNPASSCCQLFGLAAFTLLLPMTGVVLFVHGCWWCCPTARWSIGLHQGRRLLRGGQGELRPAGRPGRRRGAADRLRGHGRRADRRGHAPRSFRVPGARPRTSSRDHPIARHPAHVLRQPARDPGGRADLRAAHLPVLRRRSS